MEIKSHLAADHGRIALEFGFGEKHATTVRLPFLTASRKQTMRAIEFLRISEKTL